jgi:predicted transcriptional regulator
MTDPFTPIPNHIIDNMHQMKGSVLHVVLAIVRKTAGYSNGNGGRKEWDAISLTQFEQLTGLKRPTIITALHSAVEGGWIERRERGQSFEYRLVKNLNQLEILTSKEILPVEEETSKEILPELVKKFNTQKKGKKEKKEIPANADKPLIDEGNDGKQKEWFEALFWLVYGHDRYSDISSGKRAGIGKVATELKAKYTIDNLRAWYRDVWTKEWPGRQKDGTIQRPKLTDVKEGIGRVITTKDAPAQLQTANQAKPYRGMQVLA